MGDNSIHKYGKTTVWYIGGEDVRLRIPILKKLESLGFGVAAVGSEESEPFDVEGIEYHRYSLKRGISPFSDAKSIQDLVKLFKIGRPTIVHAFDTKPALLVPKAAKIAGVGVQSIIRTITGMGYIYSSRNPAAVVLRLIYRSMQKRACQRSDVTIFQNDDDKNYFESTGLLGNNLSNLVRGSGVDIVHLHKQRSGDKEINEKKYELGLNGSVVVTMITRLVRHKGIVEFLEAAREITSSSTECKFLLVGPQASEGRQAVPKKVVESYQDSVIWLGSRSDVTDILSMSDIFVLPSYYREGVPRVLLEAGAFGLPIITTDMPGCRDVVREGIEGLLIPPRNSNALSKAILKLASSKELRQEMGEKVRARVKDEFLLDNVANAYAEIYKKYASI